MTDSKENEETHHTNVLGMQRNPYVFSVWCVLAHASVVARLWGPGLVTLTICY